jgi:hypothetical protein
MRKFKGIELPVNAVIIIALAIFVLLMMAAFFSNSGSEVGKTQLKTAFDSGCSQLSSLHQCSTDESVLKAINTNIVQNSKALSLLDVCRQYYNNPLMSAADCVKACSVCSSSKFVTERMACDTANGNKDCQGPYTSNWECTADGCCPPTSEGGCSSTSSGSPSGAKVGDPCPTPSNFGICSHCGGTLTCKVTGVSPLNCGCA